VAYGRFRRLSDEIGFVVFELWGVMGCSAAIAPHKEENKQTNPMKSINKGRRQKSGIELKEWSKQKLKLNEM